MGLDVSATVCLGFRVEKSDFVTESSADHRFCDRMHRAKDPDVKFCSECGSRFKTPIVQTPTALLRRVATHLQREAEELWEEWWPEECWAPEEPAGQDVGLLNVAQFQDSEDYARNDGTPPLVFGVNLMQGGSHRRSSSDLADLAVMFEDDLVLALNVVRGCAELMGLKDRPIGLYLRSYASY